MSKEDEVLLTGIARAPVVTMNLSLTSHQRYLMKVQRDADHVYYLTKAREVVEGVKKPYYHTTHKNLTYPCKACAFDEATKAALKALGGVNDGKD